MTGLGISRVLTKGAVSVSLFSLGQIYSVFVWCGPGDGYDHIKVKGIRSFVASSPDPPCLSVLHTEKREGLRDNVMSMVFQADM
jgi:hypothetical protein